MNPYITEFASLHAAKIAGKQAPHKAILLLSILYLVEIGVITTPKIVLTEKIEETFGRVWKHYIGTSLIFTPKVATPFWHMQNEPFYRLYLNNGQNVSGMKANYSVKWLRENTHAIIDKELFALMQDENARAELRVNLIGTYIKELHVSTEQILMVLAILGTVLQFAA